MNAHRCFLENVCFPLFLNKPDEGGGGGGGEQKVEAPKTLAEANTQLAEARSQLATALKDKAAAEQGKATAENEKAALQGQFDAATTAANDAKAEAKTAAENLAKVTKERDDAVATSGTKDQRIKNLEALCGVQGVDPNQAVPAAGEEAAKSGLLEKFMKASASDKAAMIRSDGAALYAEARARGIELA